MENAERYYTTEILFSKMISETEGEGASFIIERKGKEYIVPKKLCYQVGARNILRMSNVTAVRLSLI